MLHDHDDELEMADNTQRNPPLASPAGKLDGRVNPAADSMLSMQLELAARLNENFPSIHYYQQGVDYSASAVQPPEYHISDSSSELDNSQQYIQDPMNIYRFPQQYERHPFMINDSTCATPLQASKMHIQDYPDVTVQPDFQQDYALNNSSDMIQLQAPAVMGEYRPQELQVHQKHPSMCNRSVNSTELGASHVRLQDSLSSGTRGAIAAWEEASKFHQDVLHQQNQQQQYDQEQAFLNFLRFSNAPRGVNRYCRGDIGDARKVVGRGKFVEDEHELLELLDGRPRGSVTVSASAVVHIQTVNDISPTYHDKKLDFTTSSSCKDAELGGNTGSGEAFTSSCQANSSLQMDLEYNYNTAPTASSLFAEQPRTIRGDSSHMNPLPAIEPKMKQVFRTEKQRRDFIKERYKTLQSLVPRYSKTDRASIVGDTIRYIHVLHHQIKELTLKKEQRRERKNVARSQTTGEGCGESQKHVPGNYERTLADFCNSGDQELQLASKHGAAVKFQLISDELHVKIVQKRERYFLNRLLTSLTRFDLVSTSGGIIDNHHVQNFILKIKGNLREVAIEMMTKIMETLDQVP